MVDREFDPLSQSMVEVVREKLEARELGIVLVISCLFM